MFIQEHDLGFVLSETVQDFGGAHEVALIQEEKHNVGSSSGVCDSKAIIIEVL